MKVIFREYMYPASAFAVSLAPSAAEHTGTRAALTAIEMTHARETYLQGMLKNMAPATPPQAMTNILWMRDMDAISTVSMDLGTPTYMMSETSFFLKWKPLSVRVRYVLPERHQNMPTDTDATDAIPVASPAPIRPRPAP